jgi:hypothetical protein
MDDLRISRYCLFVGDAHQIADNYIWQARVQSNMSTLQWRAHAPKKPAGSDGDAILGLIGLVSIDGSTLSPDAGLQVDKSHNYVLVILS